MYKWLMASVLIMAGLLTVFLLLTGLPEKQPSEQRNTTFVVPERAIDAEQAKQIYENKCMSCHGAEMQGGVGPSLLQAGTAMTKEQIYTILINGKRGMPAFEDKLSEDEIITITTWLASLK